MTVNFFDLFKNSASSSAIYSPSITNISVSLPFYYCSNQGLRDFASNLRNLKNITFKDNKLLSYVNSNIANMFANDNNLTDFSLSN